MDKKRSTRDEYLSLRMGVLRVFFVFWNSLGREGRGGGKLAGNVE